MTHFCFDCGHLHRQPLWQYQCIRCFSYETLCVAVIEFNWCVVCFRWFYRVLFLWNYFRLVGVPLLIRVRLEFKNLVIGITSITFGVEISERCNDKYPMQKFTIFSNTIFIFHVYFCKTLRVAYSRIFLKAHYLLYTIIKFNRIFHMQLVIEQN